MNYPYECPHVPPSLGSTQFVGGQDLIFLRDNAADEIGAIVGYLECAAEVKDRRISRRFREVAQDEAGHFISLLRMIASLDPIQAEELAKVNLPILNAAGCETDSRENFYSYGGAMPKYGFDEDDEQPKKHFRPYRRSLECLQNAIRDEFHAINAYQKQIESSTNPHIQSLLTSIMNKEKEHVAEFSSLIYEVIHHKPSKSGHD